MDDLGADLCDFLDFGAVNEIVMPIIATQPDPITFTLILGALIWDEF